MEAEDQNRKWQEQSQPIFAHIAQWRQDHPHATMAEIEQVVDEQMQVLRAKVVQDAAGNSPLREFAETPDPTKLRCPDCGVRLQARGQRERHLQTHGGQTVSLKRTYLSCPRCGYGLFPLDKELGLGPSSLMPHVHQALVRLGASLPFDEVAEHLKVFFGVQVSKGTVIRRRSRQDEGVWQCRMGKRTHWPRVLKKSQQTAW